MTSYGQSISPIFAVRCALRRLQNTTPSCSLYIKYAQSVILQHANNYKSVAVLYSSLLTLSAVILGFEVLARVFVAGRHTLKVWVGDRDVAASSAATFAISQMKNVRCTAEVLRVVSEWLDDWVGRQTATGLPAPVRRRLHDHYLVTSRARRLEPLEVTILLHSRPSWRHHSYNEHHSVWNKKRTKVALCRLQCKAYFYIEVDLDLLFV